MDDPREEAAEQQDQQQDEQELVEDLDLPEGEGDDVRGGLKKQK
jgi:hypothetical protein